MFEKIKPILQQLFSSKKRLIIILSLLLIIAIILSISSKPTPPSEPSPDALPQPSFSPYSKTFKSQKSTSETPTLSIDKTILVYQLPSFSSLDLQTHLNPIANQLDFTHPPEEKTYNSIPHLLWSIGSNYLDANLTTSQFYLRYGTLVSPGTPDITETTALQIAKTFLTKHNLINHDTPHQTQYLEIAGYQVESTSNPSAADFYEFHFYPTLNSFPLYSTDFKDSPIIISITKKGEIFELNYNLPTIFYSAYLTNPNSLTTSTHPLKTQSQLNDEINQGLPIITNSELEPGIPAAPYINPKKITYHQINLAYQASPNQKLLLPIFQLQGTAELEDGTTSQITAYLPAIAQ